jgi:hypothetical protein
MVLSDDELLPLVRTCIGRHDDYAFQRDDGRYVRAHRRLTYDVLRRHMAGVETIGTYVINEQGCCRFAVFDADSDAGLVSLLSLHTRFAAAGIPSYLEASRRGVHLRIVFAAPAPAALVRRWLLPSCPAGVEFYPKQDTASSEHPGSLVRVPLGVHRVTGRRYPFVTVGSDGRLVPVVSSVKAALSWLSTIDRAPVPSVPVAQSLPQRDHAGLPTHKKCPSKNAASSTQLAPTLSIRDWNARQNPFAVIGRHVELDSRGIGCCPFGWHHANGRDVHPSFKVYEPTYAGGYCWYCSTWQRGGSVFDFLSLYHNLEARDLWWRILSGEQL